MSQKIPDTPHFAIRGVATVIAGKSLAQSKRISFSGRQTSEKKKAINYP